MADTVQSDSVRKRKAAERYAANVRKKAKHAAKRDHAEDILCTSLVMAVMTLILSVRSGTRVHTCTSVKEHMVYQVGTQMREK